MEHEVIRCCVSNETIYAGYVWHDGNVYKYEEDLIKKIIEYLNEFYQFDRDWVVVDNETLKRVGWYFGLYYYSEWEEANDRP